MSRPFFNYSGQQLIDIFEGCNGDRTVLKTLQEELLHRNTSKMKALRHKVNAALNTPATDLTVASNRTAELASLERPLEDRAVVDSARSKNSRRPPEPEPTLNVIDAQTNPATRDETRYAPSASALSTVQNEANDHDAVRRGELGSIRPCGHVSGVPSRWVFPPKRDIALDVPANAPRIVQYVTAIRTLIKEMRKKGRGMRTVALEGGTAVTLDGRERGYNFAYDGDAELFEGAKVMLAIGGRNVDGRIVAISNRSLTISVDDNLGTAIGPCILKIDNTAMVEALADRLEKISKGEDKLNVGVAEDALQNVGTEQSPARVPPSFKLNDKQHEVVGRALTNTVTYLWGPPGTGKTVSLSVATQLFFEGGKRVLLCSNTNQAVDQILLKLCKTLEKNHQAMKDGKIIRLGQIQHNELKSDWSAWVTLDGIVERKSEGLKKRKVELEEQIDRIRRSVGKAQGILERFKLQDVTERHYREFIERQRATEKALHDVVAISNDATHKLEELKQELAERSAAGALRRILLRSEQQIKSEIATAQATKDGAARQEREFQTALASVDRKQQEADISNTREMLRRELVNLNRALVQKEVDEAEEKLFPLNQEITEINRQLEAIEKTVIAEARILGATVTKTYLSPQLFGDFDVVIIDEASMVMLPAIFYVCGLAKEKVVISGDFRQLAPIVPTDQSTILEIIGHDIFRAAGIEEAFMQRQAPKRTVMLEQQYRMTAGICDLISPRMYNGHLKTSVDEEESFPAPPPPFEAEMTVIDTSPIQPFVNKHGTSRYNLMHALTVRNACRHLTDANFVEDGTRLGICTPYAAQKDVFRRVLKGWGLDGLVEAGTVHHYQGDEKAVMIIDVPDSLGERYVGVFAQAEHPDDDGCKLFNVAVSRAKSHVIFVANLDYLDRKLPAQAFLREILSTAVRCGQVVDVRDVLAMWPIEEELRRLGRPFSLEPETLRSGLFRQADFEAVCGADMENAQKSIALFSGFVTPQRIATYEALFRQKLAEGVAIRCVTRPPKRNGTIPEDLGKDALDSLEAMGCVVDTRWDIHEKVVIIDDEVVWFGSLNPLSHTNRTDEMMARFTGQPAALQLSAFMAVGSSINPDKAQGLSVAKENPRCPDCGARTVYRSGRYGPYWQCEKECGWSESVDRTRRSNATEQSNLPKNGPACPVCRSQTVLRHGRHGEFYGCSKYPECRGTINIKDGRPVSKTTKGPKRKRSSSSRRRH